MEVMVPEIYEKGSSPFYPGHPVPKEFFVGRKKELQEIGSKFVDEQV